MIHLCTSIDLLSEYEPECGPYLYPFLDPLDVQVTGMAGATLKGPVLFGHVGSIVRTGAHFGPFSPVLLAAWFRFIFAHIIIHFFVECYVDATSRASSLLRYR